MWPESVGSITIELIARPRKESMPGETHAYVELFTHAPASFFQWLPPSMVL